MWSSEQLLLFVLRVQVCLAPFADGLEVLSFPLGRSWTPERLRSSLRGAFLSGSLEIRCGVSGVAFMQGLVWAGAFSLESAPPSEREWAPCARPLLRLRPPSPVPQGV